MGSAGHAHCGHQFQILPLCEGIVCSIINILFWQGQLRLILTFCLWRVRYKSTSSRVYEVVAVHFKWYNMHLMLCPS